MSFAVTAVAGLAITAVGAGVSAYGAAKNAKAIGAANASNAQNEDLLYERQSDNLNKLIKGKNRKLKDLGGIFDRFESTGAFGDTDTLKNLRKAQSDFSQLAAGNFTAFEDQLKQNMSDALVNTVGAGSPVGSYAELAANTQMGMRTQGVQTSVGISEYLSNEASKLLGAEFGIMDQKFNTGYQMDRTRVSNVANYRLGKAATEGMGEVAYGNAGMQIGSAITSYGMNSQTMGIQQGYLDTAMKQAGSQQAVANRAPVVSNYSTPTYSVPSSYSVSNLNGSNPSTIPSLPEVYSAPGTYLDAAVPYPNYTPNYENSNGAFQFSGYLNPGDYAPQYSPYTDDTGMLPPLTYQSKSSLMSSVGASIVRA